jgi:spermidine synthase / saccharopine dehydrogenase (NADP+, L-glutamate-forming)
LHEVLLAFLNDASYTSSHQTHTISGAQLMSAAQPYFVSPIYAYVAYPNREG